MITTIMHLYPGNGKTNLVFIEFKTEINLVLRNITNVTRSIYLHTSIFQDVPLALFYHYIISLLVSGPTFQGSGALDSKFVETYISRVSYFQESYMPQALYGMSRDLYC